MAVCYVASDIHSHLINTMQCGDRLGLDSILAFYALRALRLVAKFGQKQNIFASYNNKTQLISSINIVNWPYMAQLYVLRQVG